MHIEERGEKTYLLTWELGRDPATGRRRQKRKTFHGTKNQAQEFWLKEKLRLERGTDFDGNTATVQDWLVEWYATVKRPELRPRTQALYEDLMDRYLIPELGAVRLQRLRPEHLQTSIRKWQAQPRGNGQDGTLSRTIALCKQILHGALATAVQWQLVERNITEVVTWPKVPTAEAVCWTIEEAQTFLAASAGARYAIAWQLALLAGLRKGEVLGLRWQDVDYTQQTLTVSQIRQRSEEQPFGPPKTAKAHRIVAIDPATCTLLQAHRKRQVAERLKSHQPYADLDLVVATRAGRPVSDRNLTRSFHNEIKKLNRQTLTVPRIPFHGLRHTHATVLAGIEKDAKVLANRLGHTKVSFTYDTYIHPQVETQRKGAAAVAAQLLDPQRAQNGHFFGHIFGHKYGIF